MLSVIFSGMALHLFATTPMGIYMATVARSMPQFDLLMMLTLLPLQMLSGGMTPRESMPVFAQNVMLGAPTTHFVSAAQAILYRGAGLEVVWPQFLAHVVIGTVLHHRPDPFSQNHRDDGMKPLIHSKMRVPPTRRLDP